MLKNYRITYGRVYEALCYMLAIAEHYLNIFILYKYLCYFL